MRTRPAVLIVDDDQMLSATLIDQLAATDRFDPIGAASIAAAKQAISEHNRPFNAAVLDVGLPDGNGREFCAQPRKQGLRIPILMLTTTSEETDVVAGLESCADNYLTKPFRLRELMGRLDRALDNFEKSIFGILEIGPHLLQPAKRRLHDRRSDQDIHLTDKETAVLRALYDPDGERIDKETLVRQVFGYGPTVNTHTLETHVYRLRLKIEDLPMNPKHVVTSGAGYRLRQDSAA